MREIDEVGRLRTIIEAQRALAAELDDPGRVMELVMAKAEELTEGDGAIVGVIEDDDMVYRAVSGIVDGMLGIRLDVDAGLAGRCMADGAPLRSDDTEIDERVDQAECRRTGIRSLVALPLRLQGASSLGVLMVVSGRPGAFTDVDIESLEAIAPYIALALRDATDWQAVDRRLRRDPLTGVANRAAVLERLNVWMAEEGVHGAVTLHFVVLDESRSTGGTPGPAAGDLRLKEVAAALNSGVRSDDLVGRLRRDEFVVVCRRIGVEDADRMGERLAELAQGIVVVSRSRPDESADELLRRADEAMCERTGVRRAPKSSSAEAGT